MPSSVENTFNSCLPLLLQHAHHPLRHPPSSSFQKGFSSFVNLRLTLQISTCCFTRGHLIPSSSATKNTLAFSSHSPVSSLCPPADTPGLRGVFRGEQRRSAQAKIPLHPEEANRAQHQVAEAVHLEAEWGLLTPRGREDALGNQITRRLR